MGRLKTIELDNFKSYDGYQCIGPFKSFQCVIGPNGAGKSNLMDAISFVLGVKSRHLRSHKLGDLVFRADGKAVSSKRRASVKLVYELDADEIEGREAGEEIHFMRTVAASGVGSYRIDDKEVTWENYDTTLRQIGVLTKARNFLVFQGDVESVASKSPKELTALIEQISGAEEYRAQYEELKKQKDEAEENTIFRLQQKKGYAAEKKQVREQKEEAERFNAKKIQLSSIQREFFLFQLFHIRKEMSGHQETIEEYEENRKEIQGRESAAEQELKSAKKSLVKANQELTAAEKAVHHHKTELDKLEPKHVKQAAEIKNLKKKISDDEKSVQKISKDEKDLVDRVEAIKEDISQLEEAEDALDKEAQEAHKKSGLKLDAKKAEEYESLKAECDKLNAADRSELESQRRQQQSDENTIASLETDLVELNNKLQQDKDRLESLKERATNMNATVQEAKNQVRSMEKESAALQEKEIQDSTKRTKLEADLAKVQAQLRDAKDDHVQSKQEEKMAECLDTLKRLFPGVKGRLLDLCKPTQRKFDTAVTVAAGRHMDAIVVDTQQTGYECIRYMRENRVGVASFIPLTGLTVKDVNERLRSLGSKSRLCIDVIECAPEIKPAVMYAVENTVIFESLKDARDVCFRKKEQIKAVTLDGSVISKAGTMTGGNAPSDSGRGNSRWNGHVHAELVARRNSIIAELSKLDTVRHDNSAVTELQTKISQLKNKEQFAAKDVEVTNEKISGLQKQSKELKKQIDSITKEKQKLKPLMANREAAMKELQDSIEKNEDKVFGKFCRSIGVSSIREFEDGQLQLLKQTSEKRRKMREQRTKLEAQLEYEKTKDFKSPLEKINKRIAANKALLAQGEKGKVALTKSEDGIRAKLLEAEQVRDEAKSAVDEKDIEVKALQGERADCSKERSAIAKKIIAEETTVEQLRGKLHSVLQKATVEEVNLPMVNGGTFQHSGSVSESTSQTSDATSASTHFSQKDNAQVRHDKAEAEKIDFSMLKKNRDVRPDKVDGIKKDFENKIADLRSEIELIQPNMKASEKFEDVSTRHKTSAEDFDLARESARDATAMFNDIKQKRHDAFMSCFNHISNELQSIYKDLTKSSKHPLGGNAYLSLDDTEEPYLGGIKYNAMPPMKRFRDMDQLSGGEKTVAALAFLFSIHSFRPAPFFVMDEVDAALDNVNVKKVCNYIKQRSKDFQVIAISLKDIFYEQADALVGICRDVKSNSSKTLTMNLEQFD